MTDVILEPPKLRLYQEDAVQRIREAYASGAQRVLFQLPTGGGKTVVFAYIVAGAVKRGRRVLILAHRAEIVDQIEGAMTLAGADYGVIAPGFAVSDHAVQIGSVATVARRLERWRDRFDFVVVDECHHAVAGSWAKVLASQPRAQVLGVTATPERLDGRGPGEIFDELVVGPTTADLIADKWLSGFVVFEPMAAPDMSGARIRGGDYAVEDVRAAMNDGVVIGAAVDEYRRICPGVPAVAFCVDVEHSLGVAERFRAAGVKAVHVDGDTPTADRRAAVAALASGELQVLTNCNLFGEGVDVPAIGATILLRPTASLSLYLQQVGRALRPAPGKSRAVILDFAGNVARHGLPDEPRQWSLDAKPRRQRPDGPRIRRCPSCAALNRPSAHVCVECDADLRTPKERHEIAMALEEANRRELEDQIAAMSYREQMAWAGANERRLHTIARVKGYKRGWVWFKMKEFSGQSIGGRNG